MGKGRGNWSGRGRSSLLVAEGSFPQCFFVERNPAIAANVLPHPFAVLRVTQKVLAFGVVLCTPIHECVERLRDSGVGEGLSVRGYGSRKRTFAVRGLKTQVQGNFCHRGSPEFQYLRKQENRDFSSIQV